MKIIILLFMAYITFAFASVFNELWQDEETRPESTYSLILSAMGLICLCWLLGHFYF